MAIVREQPWPGFCVDLLRAATCAPRTSRLLLPWLNKPRPIHVGRGGKAWYNACSFFQERQKYRLF
jgi:hypothetical protein